MTTMTAPDAGAGPATRESGETPPLHGSGGRESRKRLSRGRPAWVWVFVVVGLLVALAAALTLLAPGRGGHTDALDPANPGPTGAQALANVLRGHGVSVTVVRSQRELLAQNLGAGTTVVITNTTRLSGRTARAALGHSASAGSLVLLDPDPEVTEGMGLPVGSHLTALEDVAAGCRSADVGKGVRLAFADRAYTPAANADAATTCFPDKTDGGAAMVVLPGAPGRPPVTLLGDESLITNGAILDSDNAAVALHVFGRTAALIWYVPTLADTGADEITLRSVAPAWFRPGVVLATSAVLFLCLWRGRRLGRLVSEPLPVVVRAVETTESRGRMYRRSRDRTRALAVLQLATRRRLTAYLGLSAAASTSDVAAAAAAVSGRGYQDVLSLLSSAAVQDDSSLLHLASGLAALEKEVRRP
jgi:hypothetical protein